MYAYFVNPYNSKAVDKNIVELEKRGDISENLSVMYRQVKVPVPFVSNRDVSLLQYWKKIDENIYEVIDVSCPMDAVPEVKKVQWAYACSMWRIEPSEDGEGSKTTGFFFLDPCGKVPDMLKKKIASRQTVAS